MKLIHQDGQMHLVAEGEKEQKKFVEMFLSDFFVTERSSTQSTEVVEKKRKMHPLSPTDMRPLEVQQG